MTDVNSPTTEPCRNDGSGVPGVLQTAFSGPVVRRALMFGVVVGSVLVSINHCGCCLNGHVRSRCIVQVVLTMCVPYTVSTFSSVLAIRDQARQRL
ncbi:MAG: nitrate/nitrite transporter NrtS [Planctomycetaceae bacterium]|nr:nitrate/nitrite transporter NrtS [Planctomycetaceae bacterium]